MKANYKLLSISVLTILTVQSYAQTDSIPAKSYLKFGVSFLNNNVYLGRADTVSTPTISPKISYTLKSGIYFSGNLDYITNRKTNALDGGSLEAGYDHSFTDNLEGGASFTKLFYSSTSTQISSAISSILNAYVDYDIADIITPALSVSYSIGKSGTDGDFLLNPNISHDFAAEEIFGDHDLLLISPEAGLNAGSQNFYAGYLQRKGKLNRKGITAAITNYDNSLGDFKLLDYEISVPIEYKTGNLIISLLSTYAFAQDSLPQATTAENLITKSIQLSSPYKPSIFYFEAGISLKF